MTKKVFVSIGKIILSGILAFIILTAFSFFYYNTPVSCASADGATDYKWESDKFYSRATEGFGIGKTNNEGYVNTFDYSEQTEVDVLVMGSSHMEGYQLATDETAASVLNSLLPDKTVYNIGVSGHQFLICANNLEAATNKYQPSEYVVIETSSIDFINDDLQKAIDGTVAELADNSNPILDLLQKNQYLRLAYVQLNNFATRKSSGEGYKADNPPQTNDKTLLDEILFKMENTVSQSGAKLIILYHPGTIISADGEMQFPDNEDTVKAFEALCIKNNILFLDMRDRFLQEYNDSYTIPYGFSNSSVGSGHLNKNGHAMIAQELYELISEVE